MKEITLQDTVSLMLSEDYKERFKAEYYQLSIRHKRLKELVEKYKAGTLDFTPNCSLFLLEYQENSMAHLLRFLEIRAEVEEIEL